MPSETRRARAGRTPMPPDPSLPTAADLLRMIEGAAVEEKFVTALDSYLTTVIDNGLGTSTFAARVIISTRASLASAVVGGLDKPRELPLYEVPRLASIGEHVHHRPDSEAGVARGPRNVGEPRSHLGHGLQCKARSIAKSYRLLKRCQRCVAVISSVSDVSSENQH